jgi:hypothetical protein
MIQSALMKSRLRLESRNGKGEKERKLLGIGTNKKCTSQKTKPQYTHNELKDELEL